MKDVPEIVKRLANDLCLAYVAEHMAKADAQMAADDAELWKAEALNSAYDRGFIGGKGTTAETRKQQELAYLGNAPAYRVLLEYQSELDLHAAIAIAERKALEATISLTREWWHTGAAGEPE